MSRGYDVEKCRDTFHPWRIYEPGDVKVIDKENLGDYQSKYLIYYNFIKDYGWFRKNAKWVSPCGTYEYRNIYEAYRCQRFKNEILEDE